MTEPRRWGTWLRQTIREVECSDDRLGGLRRRLSDDEAWEGIEEDLWVTTVPVYALELTGVRLDRTTSDGDSPGDRGGGEAIRSQQRPPPGPPARRCRSATSSPA